MNEHIVCTECGSESLVASGVFEHGTWICRLTCWTCRDCLSIVAIPEHQVRVIGDRTSRSDLRIAGVVSTSSEASPA